MQKSKVIVVGDPTTGTVINQSQKNPEWGYVKLQQVKIMVDDNGFLRRTTLNSLIQAPIEILKIMNYHANQTLEGNIVIKESLKPFNEKDPERNLKIAGKTGIVCTVEGQPIYRKVVYSTKSNAEDQTIQHDNIEELREAFNREQSSNAVIKPNEDFAL